MLFDSYSFSGLTTKNRVVMPAIHNGFTDRGFVTDRALAFYESRAAGGAGMIITGCTSITYGDSLTGMLSLHGDEFIAGHRRLSAAIKKHGALAGTQLMHPGRYSWSFKAGCEIVAPSALPSRYTGHTPRALETAEVYDIAAQFGTCARRAREAGYDLVEVIMSAGYLASQFLSPVTNHREDEFGGDFDARMRFPLMIIDSIKSAAGSDYPISVRLGGEDFMPGGNTRREMAILARRLEEHGAGLLNVTGGWHEAPVPQLAAIVPRAGYCFLAASIKNQVQIPVVASNRINDPAVAEKILQLGQADLISVARGHLADPRWVSKAQNGQARHIRKCIGCMACMDEIFERHTLLCAINPECGFEAETAAADEPGGAVSSPGVETVLVIGAGPAGLEAACRAAEKGYSVILAESTGQIGGQWNLAVVPPGKEEFRSLLDYYQNELQRLNVDLRLNHTITADNIGEIKADRIIAATGARPFRPTIPTEGGMEILHAWEVLAGKLPRGPEVVVVGGGSTGCETAVHLAEMGTLDASMLRFMMLYDAESAENLKQLLTNGAYQVKIVEMQPRLASDMGLASRWPLLTHMQHLGIKSFTGHKVREIRQNSVITEDNASCEHWLPASSVILALGSRAENTLYNHLRQHGARVYILGDAVQPARLKEAIHGAYLLIADEF